MEAYLNILRKILEEGVRTGDRTGVGTIAIPGATFEHDMADGFPLLTTKRMATRSIRVELEGFLNSITDKRWYQERGCTIWDEWANPNLVPYGKDEETQQRMREEPDLGAIYGFGWRHFGAPYEDGAPISERNDPRYEGQGYDQLADIVNKLTKDNPTCRRMICSAWNPNDLERQGLPPCHYSWQAIPIGDTLHLQWNQRSVDTFLGLPFNIASYGLLLHLLAKEADMKEGKLIGNLGNTHIYSNHLDVVEEQLAREPYPLPQAVTEDVSIYDWTHKDTKFKGYKGNHHPSIKAPIAI